MSRDIDFSKPLSEDDTAYVRQRDWLIRDAELSGFDVRLFGDVPEGADEETGSDPEDEEVDYNDFSVDELKAEIAARNEERDEDDQIEVDSKAKKADLIAALEAADAEEAE